MAANLRFLNPPSISKPPGYSHVVEATGPGRIIYLAGQLGVDVGGKVVGQPGDFRAQAVQTFENLKAALAEVGATFNDVVKINNYLTDLSHLPIFREVRDIYLDMKRPPASTTIQITALARPGALLETEAVAILPARVARPSGAKQPAAKRSAKKRPAGKAAKKLRRR
jgi:enamine deaminase RidA (YjgF/YER057c/UK114 family)